MKRNEYLSLWLLFVNIKAKQGHEFNNLITIESKSIKKYKGAWANIIVKATTINEALDIAPLGLQELNFEIVFIEKVENFLSLVENNELKKEVIAEAEWLLKSNFVFKISDKIFPYE